MTGLITDSYHWNIHQGAQQATEETNSKKKKICMVKASCG